MVKKNLSPFYWVPLCLIDGVLCLSQGVPFIVSLSARTVSVLFRSLSPVPVQSRPFSIFVSFRFGETGILKSPIISV